MFVEIELKPERLANAAIGVMEGPYSPWLSGMVFTNADSEYEEEDTWDQDKNPGLMINVTYDKPDEEEGSFTGVQNIDWKIIQERITLFAKNSPQHFIDLLNGDDDAFTHDTMWQYIVLGEVVYG